MRNLSGVETYGQTRWELPIEQREREGEARLPDGQAPSGLAGEGNEDGLCLAERGVWGHRRTSNLYRRTGPHIQ